MAWDGDGGVASRRIMDLERRVAALEGVVLAPQRAEVRATAQIRAMIHRQYEQTGRRPERLSVRRSLRDAALRECAEVALFPTAKNPDPEFLEIDGVGIDAAHALPPLSEAHWRLMWGWNGNTFEHGAGI
jgi:hypothetical protein